jgi:hypothetical protein
VTTREHQRSAALQLLKFYNEAGANPAERDSLRWFVQTQWPKLHGALGVLADAHGVELEVAQPLGEYPEISGAGVPYPATEGS